uniref:Uncharacterized protein n=1 Tax=Romanomermis culicivorax TaxID=13658 RepID=A0A915K1A1_ROMCU
MRNNVRSAPDFKNRDFSQPCTHNDNKKQAIRSRTGPVCQAEANHWNVASNRRQKHPAPFI